LKVIIDIVPNHVARHYEGLNNPEGVSDFGAHDDTTLEYHRDNNFYYIPNSAFELPDVEPAFSPLGGEQHPNLKAPFIETPAKWTGNGSRLAKPDVDDWYET
ncbi:alpha-amylase, partial [Vibrio sp. 10N.261.48.A2]